MPSMVHIGYPTLGHAWYSNKPLCLEIAKKLNINVPFDDISPFAASVPCSGLDQKHCVSFLNITGSLKILIKNQCITMVRWLMY